MLNRLELKRKQTVDVPLPKAPINMMQIRSELARYGKKAKLSSREESESELEKAKLAEHVLGNTKNNQRGIRPQAKKNLKPHGNPRCGKCDPVSSKEGVTPPSVLNNFFRCPTCCVYIPQASLGTPFGDEPANPKCNSTNEAYPFNNEPFYPGTTFSGVGKDCYSFCKALSEKETTLWHIEKPDGSLVYRPRDAKPDDLVYVDFFAIKNFAIRHAIRETGHQDLRDSPLSYVEWQKKVLKDLAPLRQKKRMEKEKMLYKDFVEMLKKQTGNKLDFRILKICDEGARGKSPLVKENGKYPHWEKMLKDFEDFAQEIMISNQQVSNLSKFIDPVAPKERTWNKFRNAMKTCCYTTVNGKKIPASWCKNFQSPDYPGLCVDCCLRRVDISQNEENMESLRVGWKDFEQLHSKFKQENKKNKNRNLTLAQFSAIFPDIAKKKYEEYKTKKNLPSLSFEEYQEIKGAYVDKRTYSVNCKMNPQAADVKNGKVARPGRFALMSIAIILIDIEFDKLKSEFAGKFTVSALWNELSRRISLANNQGNTDLKTYVQLPGSHSNVVAENLKKQEGHDAHLFILNLTNSLVSAMVHFRRHVFLDTYAPWYVSEVTYTSRKRFKGPCAFFKRKNADDPKSNALTWTVPTLVTWTPPTCVDNLSTGRIFLCGNLFFMHDISYDISIHEFFIAAHNELFTVLMPVNFDVEIKSERKVENAQAGDMISFDLKLVYIMSFSDDIGIFDGAIFVASLSDFCKPDIPVSTDNFHVPCNIYFTSGREALDWRPTEYFHDDNGILMTGSKKGVGQISVKTYDVPDLIPFELRLYFGSMFHGTKNDVFDKSLGRSELFDFNGEKWDVSDAVKKKFSTLGYKWSDAIPDSTKTEIPRRSVQSHYFISALEQVVSTRGKLFIQKTHLIDFFPRDDKELLELLFKNGKIIIRDVYEAEKVMAFYASCRLDKKSDGKSDKRSSSVGYRNKYGNYYSWLQITNKHYEKHSDCFKNEMAVYNSGIRRFPSQTKNSGSKNPFCIFDQYVWVPKSLYSKDAHSFTDAVYEKIQIPSKVTYNEEEIEVERPPKRGDVPLEMDPNDIELPDE